MELALVTWLRGWSGSGEDVWDGSEDFITCLQSYSNNITSISQLIFTSANSSFLPIWQVAVNNARFNQPETPKPSIIVTPVEESQIRTALLCTKKHGYEIRIRSGGHDFEGLSSTADVPFVMIDFTNMRSIDVDVANRTAWVQAGAALGEVYYSISQKTDTLYFPAGVCPSVGIGGYLGGGGYGNLMRKYGLGADNVVDVRFMDVNGDILDKNSMGEELFWAIRGGGASSFGIVLAWKLSQCCPSRKLIQGWQQKAVVPIKNRRRRRTVSSPPPPGDNYSRSPVAPGIPRPPCAPQPPPPPAALT
nr:berberine bridge enzyme-like 8 [Tanacetum cinerariifolium]